MCRSQHIFINPEGSGSPYAITYNCVACADNAITFNDGYHIQHHLNSKTHWSDLPKCFLESLEEHAAQGGEQQPPYRDNGSCYVCNRCQGELACQMHLRRVLTSCPAHDGSLSLPVDHSLNSSAMLSACQQYGVIFMQGWPSWE